MSKNPRTLSHILLPKIQSVFDYGRPKKVMVDKENPRLPNIPQRDPLLHGNKLLSELKSIAEANENENLPETAIITFEGEEGKDFLYDSLDNQRELKIKLLSLKEAAKGNKVVTIANVQFLNKKSFEKFSKLLTNYSNNQLNKRSGSRKNTIECTSNISSASLENLFFDSMELFPKNEGEIIWWELMLDGIVTDDFIDVSKKLEILHDEGFKMSEDRTVVLVRANSAKLLKLSKKYPYIAEIRTYKKIAPISILDLSKEAQEELKNDILSRINYDENNATGIVIFDSGINQAHPLIEPFLSKEDNKTYKEEWGTSDHLTEPHGTSMSGLVLYGNINDLVGKSDEIKISTSLKSVKIFNRDDQNDIKSYSLVTSKAFELSECQKNKAYVLAITTNQEHVGNPTEWSNCIDQLSFCKNSLFLISAGNVREIEGEDGGWAPAIKKEDYPAYQRNSCIENPAQAWNALTVGAYTEIADHNLLKSDTQSPYVDAGDLSPYSRTSEKFDDKWPIKPDVLFEGGNRVVEYGQITDNVNLHPVSCQAHFQTGDNKLFSAANATSAATALSGKFAWELMAQYPHFWPETIRGLMVHSAEWTNAMLDKVPLNSSKTKLVNEGLRCFGYGVPSMSKAKYSANNSLTLIAQHEFLIYKDNADPKKARIPQTVEFDLPWPKEILQNELGDKEVKVKITLSYFIEPNASSRGYEKTKYRYQSYGLRFEIKRPEDSLKEFRFRFNQMAREAGEKVDSSDGLEWTYGANSRNKGGSVHKDILKKITGAKLAEMGKIAVYPTKGWWQENQTKRTEDMKVRFSLLVDIETDEVDVDFYIPIQNAVKTLITN